jgi:triacylglycerol lipase
VREELLAAIAGTECRQLWLTGHSLGGALAMLAANELFSRAERGAAPIAGVYTFGQPRVGNAGFRDAYDTLLKGRTFRIVHGDDVVPRIPCLLAEVYKLSTRISNS